MLIPARRYVTAAKSAAAGYGDRIRIGPNNGLHVGVDVADKAAIVHVRAERADTDNVIGCRNSSTGIEAQGSVIVPGAVRERIVADSHVAAADGVINESLKTNRRVASTIGVVHECVVAKCVVSETNAGSITEGLKTDSRAKTDLLKPHRPGCKTLKRLITHSGIGTGHGVALERLLADSHIGADVHSLDVSERAASHVVEKRSGANRRIAAGGVE